MRACDCLYETIYQSSVVFFYRYLCPLPPPPPPPPSFLLFQVYFQPLCVFCNQYFLSEIVDSKVFFPNLKNVIINLRQHGYYLLHNVDIKGTSQPLYLQCRYRCSDQRYLENDHGFRHCILSSFLD